MYVLFYFIYSSSNNASPMIFDAGKLTHIMFLFLCSLSVFFCSRRKQRWRKETAATAVQLRKRWWTPWGRGVTSFGFLFALDFKAANGKLPTLLLLEASVAVLESTVSLACISV
jgi:hypothetical protein